MKKNTNSVFRGNVIPQDQLMPRLGKFFDRYSLTESCRMGDKIIAQYRAAAREPMWDDKLLFLAYTVQLLFDLHATWEASKGAQEIPIESHIYAGDNVA